MKIKGFSLVELMLVIVIFSVFIGIIVEITLLYNKFSREWGFLSSTALDAKEIAIGIETNMITSQELKVRYNGAGVYTILLDNIAYRLNQNVPKKIEEITYSHPYTIVSKQKEKNVKNEIYWKFGYRDFGFTYIYEISFYVYNKYAQKYRNKTVRKLVYYIMVQRMR